MAQMLAAPRILIIVPVLSKVGIHPICSLCFSHYPNWRGSLPLPPPHQNGVWIQKEKARSPTLPQSYTPFLSRLRTGRWSAFFTLVSSDRTANKVDLCDVTVFVLPCSGTNTFANSQLWECLKGPQKIRNIISSIKKFKNIQLQIVPEHTVHSSKKSPER